MNNMRQAARGAIVHEIIAQTAPDKTGTFCFDGFFWDEQKPILKLTGDHGTPDFTLTFIEGGRVLVSPDSNTNWAKVVSSNFADTHKLAQDILATMGVIMLVGAL